MGKPEGISKPAVKVEEHADEVTSDCRYHILIGSFRGLLVSRRWNAVYRGAAIVSSIWRPRRRMEFLGLLYGTASYDGSILYVYGINSIAYGNASYGIPWSVVWQCVIRWVRPAVRRTRFKARQRGVMDLVNTAFKRAR